MYIDGQNILILLYFYIMCIYKLFMFVVDLNATLNAI